MIKQLESLYVKLHPHVSPESHRRVRYNLTRWVRFMGNKKPSLNANDSFRSLASSAGLSARSIETTVRDVTACLRLRGIRIDVGRKLKFTPPHAVAYTTEQVDRLYAHVNAAVWPRPSGLAVTEDVPEWCPCGRQEWWQSFIVIACWTGMRLRDLTQITKDQLLDGTYVASKTEKRHPICVTSFLRRHVERLSDFGPALGHISPKQFRHSLRLICHAAQTPYTTPQGMRRYAVTNWSIADAQAGAIIQGCGMPQGVMRHYIDARQILMAASEDVRVPISWLSQDERQARQSKEELLLRLFQAAKLKDQELVLDLLGRLK